MNRKLASLQRITNITKHPNADSLDILDVLGWKCVAKLGQFSVGDLVVYCEVDSFLPVDNPDFEFLRKNCYRKFETGEEGFRIKTVRLRGVPSQGICFPYSILYNVTDYDFNNHPLPIKEGEDVTEVLKVKLYSPPIPASLSGKVKGQFPSFIPKTDEMRINSCPNVLERHKGKKFFITEKCDGASCSMFIKDGTFGVCSRNLELLETEGNTLWEVAKKYDIEAKLKALGRNLALQGEVVGHGIQKNPYKLKDHDIFFFSIFDIDAYRYLDYEEMKKIQLELNIKYVPLIALTDLNHTVEELVELAKGVSNLSDSIREGIVLRPLVEERDEELGRLSFKVINVDYLLECEE